MITASLNGCCKEPVETQHISSQQQNRMYESNVTSSSYPFNVSPTHQSTTCKMPKSGTLCHEDTHIEPGAAISCNVSRKAVKFAYNNIFTTHVVCPVFVSRALISLVNWYIPLVCALWISTIGAKIYTVLTFEIRHNTSTKCQLIIPVLSH